MAKIIAALVGGVLLGILAMLALPQFGPASSRSPDEITRDIVDVPKMSQAVAEQHRDEQYTGLTSVEDVIALPTEFARSEALYALAGRSDSADVQILIFDANRIADEVERVRLLNILFFRLAETDPQSALALARTEHFRTIKIIEQTVWRAWARKDFDDALFAAKTQTSVAHQNIAAQSLYAAFGYMGNETTDRIEAELEIGPDRSTRARYLYQLADRSPAEAIAFINGLERGSNQQELVSWLAYYVSLRDPSDALRYADLFRDTNYGEYYNSIIKASIARANPRATIENFLANGIGRNSSRELSYATSALAGTNLDAAMQYFEQARSADVRRTLGNAIVSEMAKTDPLEALVWARANDDGRFSYMQMTVLGQIATTDPQLALAEALKTPNTQMRSNLVSNVIQQIAHRNPANAVAYLDEIQDRQQRAMASQQLASTWIRSDPDAAVDWILSQDGETAGQLLQASASRLLRGDIDTVIRLLPRLDQRNQEAMRQQIAQQLATTRSPSEAQSFIQQFEGQPGFDQLQASVIAGVAQTDAVMAKQLADQLADGNARDRAYVQIIGQHARTDPAEAARWLGSVADENSRSVATGQLVMQWHEHDPAAATRWVTRLPAGPSRDDAVMYLSHKWGDPTAEQQKLIASIADRGKRGKAKIRQIYNLMQTDPARARQLLEDEDISNDQRQEIETMISRYRSRF